ncbi:MAG: sodium:solute symporter [Saprospiraceae bacterium]
MTNSLSVSTILLVISAYFIVLIVISYFTGKDSSNDTFFRANRESPWFLVAYGMIGATLSGVTLISIPGAVGAEGLNMDFSYMQMVFGYMVGYAFIALVLMPLYYKMNLTTIYEYLNERYGITAYKTGSFYFLVSRIIGASLRLYLVAIVLQKFVMDQFGIPFAGTVAIAIALIWVYTFRGGIKTIVWTDTIQTTCMILAVVLTIVGIGNALELSMGGMIGEIKKAGYTEMFFFEGGWSDTNNFFKQFISGALIAVVMTGLDQDMMQKNLTCKSLGDAQKNMFTFSAILIFANLLFLSLGALLYVYANANGISTPETTDLLYPTIALEHLGPTIGVLFVLGLIAAAYSSADSALTSLTTSFCIDFLNFKTSKKSESEKKRTRVKVHIGFSVLLLLVILGVRATGNDAIINQLFVYAGYTYGPLLGLFSFGMITNRITRDKWILLVCLIAPLLSYLINTYSASWLGGFKFGSMIIALNGILTFIGLWVISKKNES